MRAPNEFLGRERFTTLALRSAKLEPQSVLGFIPTAGWTPALETKTALKGDAVIRRLFLTVARLRDSTTGRRRSARLTRGGLIGVRRSAARCQPLLQ